MTFPPHQVSQNKQNASVLFHLWQVLVVYFPNFLNISQNVWFGKNKRILNLKNLGHGEKGIDCT